MIITAMYIYGISHGSWEFNWINISACFAADSFLVRLLSLGMSVNITNRTSDEEKDFWKKRTQVEELRRIEFDRQLNGKR